jgi:hypothetical protein
MRRSLRGITLCVAVMSVGVLLISGCKKEEESSDAPPPGAAAAKPGTAGSGANVPAAPVQPMQPAGGPGGAPP